MSTVPKAALYYFPTSIWCAVALLALEEKGYGADEIDLRIVDIAKGEQYDPTFLRLNPKATVPTLVVPLSNSLSEEIDTRYKAITDSVDIAEFLDKSRSRLSRTHTTSSAPAPSLAPATIAGTNIGKTIIDLVHSREAAPKTLRYNGARDEASLKALADHVYPLIKMRREVLSKHLKDAESEVAPVSEKVKKFWRDILADLDASAKVLALAHKPAEELTPEEKKDRAAFLEVGKVAWEQHVPAVLLELSKEMTGPFALGDQFSIADLHLAAWFTRIVKMCGGTAADDGKTVVEKIEKFIGAGKVSLPKDFSLPADINRKDKQTKLGAFWDVLRERPCWQKVYKEGLH